MDYVVGLLALVLQRFGVFLWFYLVLVEKNVICWWYGYFWHSQCDVDLGVKACDVTDHTSGTCP